MRRTRRRRTRRRKPLSRRWERKRQRQMLKSARSSVLYYLSYIPMIGVWALRVAGICIFAFIIVWHFGQRVSMIGDSMNPVLKNGDVVLVNRLVYNARRPRRGDIIVFRPNGNENSHYYIKRVVGLPGEKVEIREGGIYIDGKKLEEEYKTTEPDRTEIVSGETELGRDEYFVLGDDRENSEDSRNAEVGNVKRDYIFGKAWFVISPRSSFGLVKE